MTARPPRACLAALTPATDQVQVMPARVARQSSVAGLSLALEDVAIIGSLRVGVPGVPVA